MFIKKIFFPILGVIFLLPCAKSWEGVKSLNFVHKDQVINLDQHHKKLGDIEQSISDILPSNDKENIVLVTVSFLSSEGVLNPVDICGGKNKKPYIFESGWESSILNDPIIRPLSNLISDFAPKVKKEELTEDDKKEMSGSVKNLGDKQKSLETILVCYHFEKKFLDDVGEIIEQVEKNIRLPVEGNLIYPQFDQLKKNYEKAIEELNTIVQTTKNDIAKLLQDFEKNPEKKLKDIEASTKINHQSLYRQKKLIEDIGSPIIARYWHSEQKFLSYLRNHSNSILNELNIGFPPEAVIINLHSRFDICEVCQHVLRSAYKEEGEVIFNFKRALYEKFNIKPEVPFGFKISFREEREKANFKIGEKSIASLDDLTKILPILHLSAQSSTS